MWLKAKWARGFKTVLLKKKCCSCPQIWQCFFLNTHLGFVTENIRQAIFQFTNPKLEGKKSDFKGLFVLFKLHQELTSQHDPCTAENNRPLLVVFLLQKTHKRNQNTDALPWFINFPVFPILTLSLSKKLGEIKDAAASTWYNTLQIQELDDMKSDFRLV